jgi:hypothetical protein
MASFADRFGGFKTKPNYNSVYKSKTTTQMLMDGIKYNREAVLKNDGGHISTNTRNKKFWFLNSIEDGVLIFRPTVGLYNLFDDNVIHFKSGSELEVLDKFEEAVMGNDKEVNDYIKSVDEKRAKPRKPRDKK